jgi:hypothetical protein
MFYQVKRQLPRKLIGGAMRRPAWPLSGHPHQASARRFIPRPQEPAGSGQCLRRSNTSRHTIGWTNRSPSAPETLRHIPPARSHHQPLVNHNGLLMPTSRPTPPHRPCPSKQNLVLSNRQPEKCPYRGRLQVGVQKESRTRYSTHSCVAGAGHRQFVKLADPTRRHLEYEIFFTYVNEGIEAARQ